MASLTLKEQLSRRKRAKANVQGWLLISPYILVFICFSLIPVAMGVVLSFFNYNANDLAATSFAGIKNYELLFTNQIPMFSDFWRGFASTILFDAVAIPCLIIIPLFLAYLINLEPPGYKLFRAILYLPCVISITVVGIIFGHLFAGNETGWINATFGLDINWMGGKPFENDTLRWVVMLIASIWWQTGTNFVIFSGALRDVPKSLYEACEMDGGGRIRSILNVTIPNIKPSINLTLFNTLIGYLGLYGQPIVINAGFENQDYIVSPMMYIQKYLSESKVGVAAKMGGYLCAVCVVFGLIVMAFSIVQRILSADRPRKDRKTSVFNDYFAR